MIGISASVSSKWEGTRLNNQVAADNEILVYGPIVDGIEEAFWSEWLGEGLFTSNNSFRERLNAISGDVVMRIDSPGGDVWAASGIMAAISERRAKGDSVTAKVDGLAASAASLVMLAVESIEAAPMSSFMIHRASGFMYGDTEDFAKMADFLAKTDKSGMKLYTARMNLKEAEVTAALAEETWYTADEALEVGLIDSVMELSPSNAGDDEDEMEMAAAMFAQRNMRMASCCRARGDLLWPHLIPQNWSIWSPANPNSRGRSTTIAAEMKDMQESDTPWDAPRNATYARLNMDHMRLEQSLKIAKAEKEAYAAQEPNAVAKYKSPR